MANPKVPLSLSVVLVLSMQSWLILEAHAATDKNKPKPSGTVLLPLTPRIDDGTSQNKPETSFQPIPSPYAKSASPLPSSDDATATILTKPQSNSLKRQLADVGAHTASSQPDSTSKSTPAQVSQTASPTQPDESNNGQTANTYAAPTSPTQNPGSSAGTQANISAESGFDEGTGATTVDENSVLKGTVQISADDTEFDQDNNTFLGTGNAVCLIAGQNSKLEADTILYDQNHGTIDARGNVRIMRDGQLTTGSSFKFKVESDEYLITAPDTELSGTTIVAQTAKGLRTGIKFRNGDFTLPQPLHIMNNGYYGPISSAEHTLDEQMHPDAYVPMQQSYKFTARKMIYERYKQEGNLTVYGGKVVFDNFTVPLPKFVCNINSENPRVIFPVTPFIGNNMQVGGTNIGPQFNYAVGKTGCFSWAPLIQIGGTPSGTTTSSGKLGAGFKVSYSSDVVSAHLGYGTVSNLAVGDFKYRFSKKTIFQSGLNRFVNDGLFGMRRPRLIAEVVDQRGVGTIPYINYLSFRSSAGWAQDDPALIGLSGANYAKLYHTTGSGKTSAYRVEEQISASSHPIFSLGTAKYGTDLMWIGGLALRGYSTGNTMIMAQTGPMLNARVGRFRARFGYTESAVRGKSPFVFDQFIQGQQSVYMQGDVKVCKWLTLGTNLGYNLNSKLMYTRAITAAVGPDDLKLLFTRDTISGYQRMGFDILYGSPVKFNSLLVKGGADAGQY